MATHKFDDSLLRVLELPFHGPTVFVLMKTEEILHVHLLLVPDFINNVRPCAMILLDRERVARVLLIKQAAKCIWVDELLDERLVLAEAGRAGEHLRWVD